MKVLAIQHDAADPPAAAGEIVTNLGHELTTIRLDRGDKIPATPDADMLMTFGGGFSFTQGEPPPWFAAEQKLIRDYVDTQRKVLGICLGSQMISSALGGKVRRNDQVEVGWHPVESVPGSSSCLTDLFTQPTHVFHWHQDTFSIPDGAKHVLRSQGCDNQGFVIDDRVFAFQCHLEANEKTVRTFLAVSKLWRQDSRFVQTEQEIVGGVDQYFPHQQELLQRILVRLMQ
ncbi:MAG: type 1 glutamine amidotransferase [Pirellulaceae bacterium]|nr:type 1 glutamine amidotransferase [Pirellulaceae bacterium]